MKSIPAVITFKVTINDIYGAIKEMREYSYQKAEYTTFTEEEFIEGLERDQIWEWILDRLQRGCTDFRKYWILRHGLNEVYLKALELFPELKED